MTADRPATEPHPMEEYLAEQAAKPGPTMTITKAAYVFLLEQLRAAEAAQGAGRSSDPEPAPPPDDRDWTAEFHALDDAINERLRAGAVPALQATGEPPVDFADIEGDDEDGNQP